MKCINSASCLMCADGSVAMQAATQQTSDLNSGNGIASAGNEPVTCLACTSPCATCKNAPTTCLSCQSGFTLSGNNCLNSNFVAVSVTFAPTGNVYSHFNDQFATIVSGMATAAGVLEQDVVITSIIYSSVVLNGAVTSAAAPGSNQAKNIQTSLNNYFTNLNLADLTVEQSTVVDPGTTTTTDDDDSNTTLIVAIVVPILVVRNNHLIQS